MSTDHNTYDAVTAIAKIQPSIRPTSKAKIQEAKVGGVSAEPSCVLHSSWCNPCHPLDCAEAALGPPRERDSVTGVQLVHAMA